MIDVNKICELTEKYQNTEDREKVTKELNELISPYSNGSIGIAQINTTACGIEYNAKKIVKYINLAQDIGLDLVVFPELSLSGYPVGDAIMRYPSFANDNVKWLNEIAKITTKTVAIVGFIEPVEGLIGKYYNSLAVLKDGKVEDIIRKTVQSNDCEFNDDRHIISIDTGIKIIKINGVKYAITIGEDCLKSEKSASVGADVIINCSASVTYAGKEQLKCDLLSNTAKKYSAPVVYVNQVGAVDNASFAGLSMAFGKNGKLFARARAFEEQFLIVNPIKNFGKIYPCAQSFENVSNADDTFSLDYEADMERTYYALLQGIRDYFNKTGFKRAVLGLSGGLDSTVCAVLLADALGCENVFGVSMPSKITSDTSKNDAEMLAQNLGIGFAQAPIKDMFETTNNCLQKLFEDVEKNWDCRYKKSFTPDNIQARSRAMFLWGVSNEFDSCLPIATSDKSEAYMGYATINGDMSGGFAPIADVTKTKLFALARWMNKNRNQKDAIPQSVIEKRPGAELAINPQTGKPLIAEDALMPYEFLDEVIWRIENKHQSYDDMLHFEFLYEKTHKIPSEQKQQWLEKFYRRMASALYKKSIMPPYIIVDSPSYNFKQPITSGKINYKQESEKIIRDKIEKMF
ncbi:NAD(+) synthase [bacterium]|nr:NAD(+) synthase [bacterium]